MNRIRPKTSIDLADLAGAEAAPAKGGGEPVAILRGSEVVAYQVPAEQTGEAGHRVATRKEVMESFERRRPVNQPVLDWLRDK